MRDMKARSMDQQKASGVRSQASGSKLCSEPKPKTQNPKPSDFLEEEAEQLDELEPAVLVDQGDGMHVSVPRFDGGGDDGFELPDEAPPGWE